MVRVASPGAGVAKSLSKVAFSWANDSSSDGNPLDGLSTGDKCWSTGGPNGL